MLVIYICIIHSLDVFHHTNGYRQYNHFIQSLEYHLHQHHLGQLTHRHQSAKSQREENQRVGSLSGFVAETTLKGRKIFLLKPTTFMNLSGNAVRYWLNQEKIDQSRLLVISDELALPLGAFRLKGKGSDAGHNGLKHIAATLGTQNYARLRMGIGNDYPRGGQIDWVLGKYTEEDMKQLQPAIDLGVEIIKSFVLAGIDITMNQYNKLGKK